MITSSHGDEFGDTSFERREFRPSSLNEREEGYVPHTTNNICTSKDTDAGCVELHCVTETQFS